MAEDVNFGKRVQNLRTNAGLSMEQLASKLKVSKSRVNMWENGGIIPRRDMLVKVAEFFGVSTDFLLGSGQEGKVPEADKEVQIIQRGLKDMNAEQHKKALKILSAAFDDIFDDDEGD
jgi:transcriptional regulator with XRE-family HTH domain